MFFELLDPSDGRLRGGRVYRVREGRRQFLSVSVYSSASNKRIDRLAAVILFAPWVSSLWLILGLIALSLTGIVRPPRR